ncbi:MAG: hypothetical protein IJ247_03270 [Bacilli bacterium]|nr:hypothetical protein [Bacilli bacterium]
MVEYLLPTRIVESKGVSNLDYIFKGTGLYGMHFGKESLWADFTKFEGKGSYIVLDFGKEMCGGLRLFTAALKTSNCKIRVRFGESLGEVNSSIGDKRNPTNDHALRDFETSLTWSADLEIGNTGFRFARIDILEDKFAFIRGIYCKNNIFSAPQIYDYSGKDECIKKIFEAAKRTIDLCASSNYIWDGIKRDRVVWIGDCAPEVMALMTLYGDVAPIRNSLDSAQESFPIPVFINAISTYSMWWVIILHDYYEAFNCVDYLKSKKDYLLGLEKMFDDLIDENGNLSKDVRHMVDWPTVSTVDEDVGIRSIFLLALNKMDKIYSVLGLNNEKLLKIRRKTLIKPLIVKEKKQVIALKYFATGEMSDEEYELLIKDGAKGFSTFMSYYILSAIASKDEALAIKLMKDYYGAMLEKGATTFWEDFDIDWCKDSGRIDEIDPNKKDIHGDYGAYCYIGYRHSLCHGWSTGVIKFIKEHC